MQTLIEFVKTTKGWEYIVAILSLLRFTLFWRLVTREPRAGAKKEGKS